MAFRTHYSFRAVLKTSATEDLPISEWTDNWKEAQAVLFERGLAGYVYGIFVMHPHATIEMEVYYR